MPLSTVSATGISATLVKTTDLGAMYRVVVNGKTSTVTAPIAKADDSADLLKYLSEQTSQELPGVRLLHEA